MTTRKIAISAICTALVIGATATATLARPHGGGPGMMQGQAFVRLLKLADADKNGQVTKAEFTTARDALFTAIDADKDGSITPKEFGEYRKAKFEEFRKANPRPEAGEDGRPEDGKRGDGPRHGDGQKHGDGPRHADRDGPGKGKDHGKGWRKGHDRGFLNMLDTDGNGQVSKAEFDAGADRLFERMDRNKDGVINIDDIPDRPFP